LRQVLFDSDVLIDVLSQREPFASTSAQALSKATQSQVKGYVSGHAVTNIFYILRRQVGRETARELLARLLQHLQVASVTDEVIRAAMQSSMTDFEDAVTSQSANAARVEMIITRNLSDFVGSSVPAVSPAEFLAMP
jgi:predicted nucleic-acid-binding protein